MTAARALPPTLYGLALDPPTLHPGGTTLVTLTMRNRAAIASPPLHVRFLLPPELAALDALDVAIASIAPGGDGVASCAARLAEGACDGTTLPVQAVVSYDGREAGTNVALATVRAEPHLTGDGTTFELHDTGDGTVRCDVRVRNDGDGAADDCVVAIPPQPGLAARAPVTLALGSLAPGDSRTASVALEVAPGAGTLSVDGILVQDARGRRSMLAGRATLALAQRLAPPHLTVGVDGDRIAVCIGLATAGPVHVDDVEVAVHLPAGFRMSPASMRIDGAPVATARGKGKRLALLRTVAGGFTVAVARIAAGSPSALTFDAHRSGVGGRVDVVVRGAGAEFALAADVAAAPPAAPRLVVLDAPAVVHAGGCTVARVELAALGGVAMTVRFDCEGAELTGVDGRNGSTVTLAAGEVRDVALELHGSLPGSHEIVVRCWSDDAQASLRVPLIVRGNDDDVDGDDASVRPRGGAVDADVSAPERATAGATVEFQLALHVTAAAAEVRVRLPQQPALTYVPGSTRIDEHEILDGTEPALLAGLVLRDVADGTSTTIAWRVRIAADATGELAPIAEIAVDGAAPRAAHTILVIEPPDIFASRPGELTFHVEAPLVPLRSASFVASLPPVPPPPPEPVAAIVGVVPELLAFFDDERAAAALRLLDGGEIGGIVPHVLALRVLFPADVQPADRAIAAALNDAYDALRDVLDRLFVKIRIPGYDVSGHDCEDAASRTALAALIDALPPAHPRAAGWREVVQHCPIGDPAALAVIAELLDPAAGAAGAAAHAYATAIAATLHHYAREDPSAFDAALARVRDVHLDDARARFSGELRTVADSIFR